MYSQEVFLMQTQYLIPPEVPQVPPYEAQQMAQGLAGDLALFLFPLLVTLDRLLDKRLVRTFLQTIQVILAYRDRVGGLLLSELGGYLLSPEQAKAWEQAPEHPVAFAPSGMRRWSGTNGGSRLVSRYTPGRSKAKRGWPSGMRVEWEKPESKASQDLCAVRSSKAK